MKGSLVPINLYSYCNRKIVKALPVIAIAFLFVLSISAGTVSADDNQSTVQAMPFPSITLNITQSAFYNLSFLGLVLHDQNGIYNTIFNKNHWNFDKHNNTTYYYTGNVGLAPGEHFDLTPVSSDSYTPAIPEGGPPISASVNLTLSALGYQLSNVKINNTSSPSGSSGYLFPNYSVMEITVNITFDHPIPGPGQLYLFQLIKSSNSSKSAAKYYLGNVTHNLEDRMQGDHRGLQILPGDLLNSSAFYWWNNTFDLNGVNQTLQSRVGLAMGGILVTFEFPFNSTLTSIFEDPYFGVPGTHLFQNPIVEKGVKDVVAYLIVHAEFLSAGAAAGIGILGISYSMYRRKKF